MNLSVGIVGLPNVGKSTLFNALLKKSPFAEASGGQAGGYAKVADYPFTTIEPNVGVVEVPDSRLEVLAKIVNTQKIIPAVVKFVDIAGLVKGAAEGAGLGNKFLSHIREVDAICHVIKLFGSSSPKDDFETIKTELDLADLEMTEKHEKKNADEEELPLFSKKPVIVALNVDEKDLKNLNELENKFSSELGLEREQIVIISAKIESELADLGEEEQKAYLESLGLKKSGLERLIEKAYETLGLISFLTAGEKEVRAWTIKNGTKAPQAAGVIHTDFEKGFIKAEVVSYDDFVALGGWQKAKEMGKARLEGKEYIIKDGEVIEFKFNL